MPNARNNKSCKSKIPFWCDCKLAYAFLILCALIIIIYWIYLKLFPGKSLASTDILNQVVYEIPEHNMKLSYWPASHFVFFFILGILFPQCDVLIIGAGILWELIEAIMGYVTKEKDTSQHKDVQYYNWWGASWYDIVLNILGFYVGKAFITIWRAHTDPYRKPLK